MFGFQKWSIKKKLLLLSLIHFSDKCFSSTLAPKDICSHLIDSLICYCFDFLNLFKLYQMQADSWTTGFWEKHFLIVWQELKIGLKCGGGQVQTNSVLAQFPNSRYLVTGDGFAQSLYIQQSVFIGSQAAQLQTDSISAPVMLWSSALIERQPAAAWPHPELP